MVLRVGDLVHHPLQFLHRTSENWKPTTTNNEASEREGRENGVGQVWAVSFDRRPRLKVGLHFISSKGGHLMNFAFLFLLITPCTNMLHFNVPFST